MIAKYLPLVSLILVTLVLLYLSYLPTYRNDLIMDAPYFYAKSEFFLQHLNFSGITNNEYQPGALIFFILLTPALLISNNLDTFVFALFSANILLIFLNGFIFTRTSKNNKSLYIYSAILLFSGPILLFRFDLAVITLVNLLILLWMRNHKYLSLLLLSIAIQVKIYPILFLPIFLVLEYKNHGLKSALKLLIIFASSSLIFLILFFTIFGSTLNDLIYSLNYHSLKLVHIESLSGQLIYLYQTIFLNHPPSLEVINGIWGISKKDLFFSLSFYNWIWIFPYSLFCIYFLIKSKRGMIFDLRVIIFALLLFLVFSKVLTHQYFFWFLLLLPNLNYREIFMTKFWRINLALVLIITLIHQYLYPLNYLKFIEVFSNSIPDYNYLIYLNILRNLLIVVLLLRLLTDLKTNREI